MAGDEDSGMGKQIDRGGLLLGGQAVPASSYWDARVAEAHDTVDGLYDLGVATSDADNKELVTIELSAIGLHALTRFASLTPLARMRSRPSTPTTLNDLEAGADESGLKEGEHV